MSSLSTSSSSGTLSYSLGHLFDTVQYITKTHTHTHTHIKNDKQTRHKQAHQIKICRLKDDITFEHLSPAITGGCLTPTVSGSSADCSLGSSTYTHVHKHTPTYTYNLTNVNSYYTFTCQHVYSHVIRFFKRNRTVKQQLFSMYICCI